MKKLVLIAIMVVFALGIMLAVAPKTYQVTGTVTALTDDIVTVKKGDELWEIARVKETKATGDLKVGAKVTIQYRMVAAKIEVK
jgi:hypothetical protein